MISTVFQISSLWYHTTTALACVLMFDGMPRIGVIQHLQLAEYEAAERGPDGTVVWVAKHKIGDKKPATLVLDQQVTAWMDR